MIFGNSYKFKLLSGLHCYMWFLHNRRCEDSKSSFRTAYLEITISRIEPPLEGGTNTKPDFDYFPWAAVTAILVHSGCYNKYTTNYVAYKQYPCISYHSGVWEIQDHGVSISVTFCYNLTVKSKRSHWSLFYKGTNPIHRGSILMT